jgi:hypothetical protein
MWISELKGGSICNKVTYFLVYALSLSYICMYICVCVHYISINIYIYRNMIGENIWVQSRPHVLVSSCYHNKLPQTYWLQTRYVYDFPVLQARKSFWGITRVWWRYRYSCLPFWRLSFPFPAHGYLSPFSKPAAISIILYTWKNYMP